MLTASCASVIDNHQEVIPFFQKVEYLDWNATWISDQNNVTYPFVSQGKTVYTLVYVMYTDNEPEIRKAIIRKALDRLKSVRPLMIQFIKEPISSYLIHFVEEGLYRVLFPMTLEGLQETVRAHS